MFETVSVFDALELDNTHLRVASRRALALAHNRVESNLGRFLRGAQSETEFLERLALVADDFEGYVVTASAEVGHDHPEHIAAALKDHYRLAADKVEFEETPAEEQEKKDEEVVASVTEVSPKKAKKTLKRMAKAGRTWKQAMPLEGEQGSPLGSGYPDEYPDLMPGQGDPPHYPHGDPNVQGACPNCGTPDADKHPGGCPNCGFSGNPYGGVEHDLAPYGPAWQDEQRDRGHFAHSRPGKTADMYTGDEPSGHKEVTCPECGGDGKTAGNTSCGKCKGKGKVPNFGDSVLDAYFGKTAEQNQNNTDLDGPEPKMDKRLWTPSNPGKPKYEDGPRHPTKDKDPTEVIGPMRNDHELSEIHGQGTHYKKETLPTQDGDEPFASNNMEMAPHTKTFGDKDQHDPVTHETLESVQSSADDPHKNPLVELLQSEWPANQAVTAAFPQ